MKALILSSLLSINTEHQIRLCDDNKKILEKLQLDKIQEKKSLVYYFETADRQLSKLGVSIRLKLKQNNAEITVKKRFAKSKVQQVSSGLRVCENDLHGGVKELSCKITSPIDKNEFEKVLAHKKNWLEILSKEQLEFIKQYKADVKEALVFGVLADYRYQWIDKDFGSVTVDLVSQVDKEEIHYNEISIRYDEEDTSKGDRFEKFFKSTGVKPCEDQLEWVINKFDTLQIFY